MTSERPDAMENRLDRVEAIVEANTKAIADLRASMVELREGQALLVQIVSQEQDALREFRRTTKATLDRIENIQREQRQQIAELRQDFLTQQQRLDTQQQQITTLQQQVGGMLEYLLRREGDNS